MSTYYLRGAIENNDKIIFTIAQPGEGPFFSYLLQDIESSRESVIRVVLAPTNTASNLTPAVFTVNSSPGGITFSTTSFNNTKMYMVPGPAGPILTATPSIFMPYEPGFLTFNTFGLLLVGVGYAFKTTTHQPLQFSIVAGGETTVLPADTPIRVLPDKWFPMGACQTSTEGFGNITTEEAAYVRDPESFQQKGFVSQSDCEDNIFYNYCRGTATCGANNCKGPCTDENSGKTCALSNNNFSCETVQGKEGSKPWYKNPWIWIAIAGAVVLVFILILLFSS